MSYIEKQRLVEHELNLNFRPREDISYMLYVPDFHPLRPRRFDN